MNLTSLTLQDYPSVTFDKVRFRDTDRQGHINNAVFSTYLETGRVELFYAREVPLTSAGCVFVIVQSNLNLVAEIQWPGTVEIGTGVLRLGNSSITLVQGLYQNQSLVATAETVIVQIDELTKKATALSETARNVLSALRIFPQ
jgi:acyl-CoA thioester hydrolase